MLLNERSEKTQALFDFKLRRQFSINFKRIRLSVEGKHNSEEDGEARSPDNNETLVDDGEVEPSAEAEAIEDYETNLEMNENNLVYL